MTAQYARMAYIRRDIEELFDFTQQVHLGMESYHSWLDEKVRKRIARRRNSGDFRADRNGIRYVVRPSRNDGATRSGAWVADFLTP